MPSKVGEFLKNVNENALENNQIYNFNLNKIEKLLANFVCFR